MRALIGYCSLCFSLLAGCRSVTEQRVADSRDSIPPLMWMIAPDSVAPVSKPDTMLWEYNSHLIPMNYIEPPEPFPAFKEIMLE